MTGNPKAKGTERAAAVRTFALRAVLSAAVVGLMLWIYDPREIFRKIEHLSIGFVLFAWAFYALCQLVSAYRWRMLLSVKGVDLSLMRLFIFYMIGMFVNNFLPGGLGGDAVKAYSVYRSSGTVNVSVASVLVERFCGILALAFLGGVACVVMLINGEARSVALWMLAVMLGISVAAAMVWSVRLASILRRILSVCAPRRIRDRAVQLMETVHSYRHDGWTSDLGASAVDWLAGNDRGLLRSGQSGFGLAHPADLLFSFPAACHNRHLGADFPRRARGA